MQPCAQTLRALGQPLRLRPIAVLASWLAPAARQSARERHKRALDAACRGVAGVADMRQSPASERAGAPGLKLLRELLERRESAVRLCRAARWRRPGA